MPLKLIRRNKVWYVRGSVRGLSAYKSTKTGDRDIAEIIRIQTEKRLLDESIFGTKATKTFDEAVASYLENGGSLRFIDPLKRTLGSIKLHSLRQADLDTAARDIYPNTQPETRNRQCYTPFIAVWNHAVKNGWADVRLWQRPRRPKGTNVVRIASTRSGQRPVDYERAAQFVGDMSPAPAMLLTALFYTGLRPIEAFALKAGNVNLAARWLTIAASKTGEPRGVPLHSFLCEWLGPLVDRAASYEDGILFRTPRGEPYGAVQEGGGGLKSAIIGARRRSGIRDVSPYTGRHAVSTQLVINGVHPHIKDQILGHAADSMSRHYTNIPQAPLIAAIDTLHVPASWRALPWLAAPQEWWARLAEGTGKRTDLRK
ncbi:tyrosine-type recombinase/integrase [Allomesorhizobium camelthorni]|uniref:Tyrosine-type recombinase/integrase n=1 Tax=Allomesorhizobium camelthorni TaxID=475069 RepID=A0A6G4WBI7_9HYPH|nr:tyrosine-type recombinase/integrase [Mesorhizobium camelthorni]NGO51596.1 tyrosine-type recombinase/integrase [Mesorhizobium camelthorni]